MSSESWKRLEEVHQYLRQNQEISDESLIDVVLNLEIMTNAEYAAFLLACAIATICGYRPQLTETLLPNVLLPLIYAGMNTSSQVIAWLHFRLKEPKPYNGTDELGIKWIVWLTTQPELIQRLLSVAIARNDTELLGDTPKWFAQFSKVPSNHIVFRPYWQDSLLTHAEKAILFFYIPVDSEDLQPLENQDS
jgi:hypothetical protein